MNHLLEVCLSITLAAGLTPSLAAQSNSDAIPMLRKGISVQMPVTRTALEMPDADKEDALVVTITDDSKLYFQLDPVDLVALAGEVRDALSNRTEKGLYVKADARAPYVQVFKALTALRTAGVETPTLLTAQPHSQSSAAPVTPAGMQVLTDRRASSGSEAIVVRQTISRDSRSVLEVNGEPVLPANLPVTLAQLLQKSSGKFVKIEADGRLPFAAIAKLIDECRSVGAKVVLAMAA